MKQLFVSLMILISGSLSAAEISNADWCNPTYCCNPTQAQ